MITAEMLQDALAAFLDGETDGMELVVALAETTRDDEIQIINAATFADEGVMTTNAGLVVYLSDGSQFHLTIVSSR
jgi:hypothetical protein